MLENPARESKAKQKRAERKKRKEEGRARTALCEADGGTGPKKGLQGFDKRQAKYGLLTPSVFSSLMVQFLTDGNYFFRCISSG